MKNSSEDRSRGGRVDLGRSPGKVPGRWPDPKGPRRLIQKLLSGLLVMVIPGVSLADSSWVTVDDLLAAILETRQFTLQQRADMDLNGDGTVDVADLVFFNSPAFNEANFSAVTSTVDEGAGSVLVTVAFRRPASCALNFTVSGSATAGTDFTTPAASVPISGTSASIPVTLLDDTTFAKEMEMVTFTLSPGACYTLGPITQHNLFIVDNDARWLGTLQEGGVKLGFVLSIAHSAAGYAVTLESDGSGTFPAGSSPGAVAAFSSSLFDVSVGPIAVAADATLFGVALKRTLRFLANPAVDSRHVVDPSLVVGEYTETISTDNGALGYLAASSQGQVVLVKEQPGPPSWTPALGAR
jgi:hypothetical protein